MHAQRQKEQKQQGSTRIEEREKWMRDLRSGVANLQDCPLELKHDYEVVLQACSSADENTRMESLRMAGKINAKWQNDVWLRIAAGVERERPQPQWNICVSKRFNLTSNARTFSFHVIRHMVNHPLFMGLNIYNPDMFDKSFCLVRDIDGEIDWDRVTDVSYPCRGGTSCQRPVLFEGRCPTTGSCWRTYYQWHLRITRDNCGFLLQIVELDGDIHALGNGQIIEEEMAIEAKIGILTIKQPCINPSEGVEEAVDELAQRYTKAVKDGQWDKGFDSSTKALIARGMAAETWIAHQPGGKDEIDRLKLAAGASEESYYASLIDWKDAKDSRYKRSAMAALDVRGEEWYPQYRGWVFTMLGSQVMEGAKKLALIAIRPDPRAECTCAEFPALMDDLRDAYQSKLSPSYINDELQIPWNSIREIRIDKSELEETLEELSNHDVTPLCASCSEYDFADVRQTLKKHNDKRGSIKAAQCWATANDMYAGSATRDPQASPLLAAVAGLLGTSVQDLKERTVIDLCSEQSVTDDHVKELANHCRDLTNIDLTYTKVTDAGVQEIARHCHNLEKIWLGEKRVTDAGVQEIAQHCHSLKEIWLTGTKVTDAGVQELAKGCPNLKEISLDDCDKITDIAIKELAQGCPLLKDIDLRRTRVTDGGIKDLLEQCPILTKVFVPKRAEFKIPDWKKQYPNVEII